MKTEQEWAEAKRRLQEVRMMYTEIGAPGLFALRLTIDPLLIRFERGERTDELFDEIMELE